MSKEKPTTSETLSAIGVILMFVGLIWTMLYIIYVIATSK